MKRAYLVWGDDVDYGGVEFLDESDINDPDEVDDPAFRGPIYKTVEEYLEDNYENWQRIPQCDDWAERGKVPVGYLVQFHNWYLNCYQCERRVDEEGWDDELETELNPVYRDQEAFCCPDCAEAYDRERAMWRSRLDKAERYVKERWPFVTNVSGGYGPDETIWFYVFAPGLSRCADWTSKDPDRVTLWGQMNVEVWGSLVKGLTVSS